MNGCAGVFLREAPFPSLARLVLCLVTQECPTLCDPMDCSPLASSLHGDSPGKNTGVGCHALLQGTFPTQGWNAGLPHCRRILYGVTREAQKVFVISFPMKVKVKVAQSCLTPATPWTLVSMEFLRPEYWDGYV